MAEDLPTGDLQVVLTAALAVEAPDLFGGQQPAVAVGLAEHDLVLSGRSVDAAAGVRVEPRAEALPVRPEQPLGPYRLQQTPLPGRRRVTLSCDGDTVATLGEDEVAWSDDDPAGQFFLRLRPHRGLDAATHVTVRYDVDAVTSTSPGQATVLVTLQGPAEHVPRARGLAIALLTLDPAALATRVVVTSQSGRWTTTERTTSLALTRVDTSTAGAVGRVGLHIAATVDVEVRRTLAEDEGRRITRVALPADTALLG